MTRSTHGNQGRRAEGDPVVVGHRSEGILSAVLAWQEEPGALKVGQQPRPRKMVGVDVGVGHRHQPPSALAEEPERYARIDPRAHGARLTPPFPAVGEETLFY